MFGIEKEKEKHETFPSLSLFRGAINYIQDDFDSCKSHHCWLTKRVIPSPLFSLALRSRRNIPVFYQTKQKREKKFTFRIRNKNTQIQESIPFPYPKCLGVKKWNQGSINLKEDTKRLTNS